MKPNWTRDELILALDLYFRDPEAVGISKHPEVIRLSEVLNNLPIHAGLGLDDDFRNPNGVAMKLSNFLRLDPGYKGKGLDRGSKLEDEVWASFHDNRGGLRDAATAILENMTSEDASQPSFPEHDDEEAPEGKVLTRIHKRRERSSRIVNKKKDQVLKASGKLECEACGFDSKVKYGERGEGFAECHHTKPVSSLRPNEKTKLSDLIVLCANCHRMVHRRRPWLTLSELRGILGK